MLLNWTKKHLSVDVSFDMTGTSNYSLEMHAYTRTGVGHEHVTHNRSFLLIQ